MPRLGNASHSIYYFGPLFQGLRHQKVRRFRTDLTAGRAGGILPYMEEQLTLQVVARIRSDFTSKFGIPRQSNLVRSLEAAVVFEPEYRDENALRGLEGYSHLWLI